MYSEAGCVLCAMTVADPGGGGFGGEQRARPLRRSLNVGQDSMFCPPPPTCLWIRYWLLERCVL